jgi:nucleotide-binding universal stress UspA family protein
MNRIVVGVDGSKGADAALAWAAEEARLRNAHLEVVHTIAYPITGGMPLTQEVDSQLIAGAQAVLDDSIARADLEGTDHEARFERGSAAVLLVEIAKGADLLVVGSRGRGGFVGLLLGSVSQQCAHHAPCPIVIVPAPDQ